MTPLFLAVKEATQEAIYNSLFMARKVSGFRNREIDAIPLEKVKSILRKYGVIQP
jgi:D-aminopeptidase